jgi:rod shape-determining protein MreB
MIVDLGGGTTDIAVLSLADIVVSTSLRVAGDAMDEAIVQHVKSNYNILIGQNTAEEIKIQIGSAASGGPETTFAVHGRDLIAGLPRAIVLTSEEIREALAGPVSEIVAAIRSILERTGPELSGDLLENGMTLCGGGVLLRGLASRIQEETGLAVEVAEDPLLAVARGTAVFIERLDDFKHILESADDDL